MDFVVGRTASATAEAERLAGALGDVADLLESVQVLALADHADEAQVRPPELRRLPHAAGLYLMAVSAGKWLASGWYRRTRGVWRSAGR